MDRVTALPHSDVLFPRVFAYLSISDLFKLRLVSKTFRDLVADYFSICTDFDFSKMKKKGNPKAFRLMTEHNRSLRRLCLAGATHWLTDLLLLPMIPSWEMLTHINLSNCSQLTNQVLYVLATCCHRLTSISLNSCYWVEGDNFKLLISNNKSLSHLDLSSCWSLDNELIQFCASSCPCLMTLKLTNIYSITDTALFSLASGCPKLSTLAVNGCWRVTNDGVRAVGEYCRQLRHLFVDDCRDVNEASLARLRVRNVIIDVSPRSVGTLRRVGRATGSITPFINLQT